MEDTRKLRDIILDQCEAKEIRIEELIKKTGIPEQHFDAIVSDVRTRLPAFPYIRQHLIKIAVLLGLPQELLLNKYRAEFAEKASGGADRLPGNRFALAGGGRRYVFGLGAVVALFIVYVVVRSGFFGAPNLVITNPPAGTDPFIVTGSSTLMIAGSIDPGDKLLINGQPVATEATGIFTREYQLAPEINIIEFSASRFLGRTITITRQVYLEEAPLTTKAAAKRVTEAVAASSTPEEAEQ